MADANLGATPNGAVALDQQPGAAAPQPQSGQSASGTVDLTAIPAFRKYQSEQDRKLAAMQEELDRLKAERAQAEEQRIAAADPDERAAYYQQQVAAMRAEQDRQAMATRIAQTIQRAGLGFDDPRLTPYLAGGPTAQTLAAVNEVIAQIALEEKRKAEEQAAAALAFQQQQSAQQQQLAAQRGAQAALVNAGVLATTNSQSVVVPADPNAEKVAAFRARYAQFRGKGLAVDNPGLRTLIDDLRKDGMTLADIA